MLTILCKKRLIEPNTFTFNSFTATLLILRKKSPINTFSSSESSDSSKVEANFTLSDKRRYKSELVISLLKSHGFTETQISKLARVRPTILRANPQKILAPKIKFFLSIGISNTDLPRIVSTNPTLLDRSLENQLIPCHNFLKSVLVLDENVVKMLKRSSRILLHNVKKDIAPNISTLTGIGVTKSLVSYMLFRFPTVAHQNHVKFKRTVEEVIRMGFNPMRSMFVHALQVLCEVNKTTLDRKWAAYRKWGLSDDEILMAFRSHPWCMNLSEEKITREMDFLVNKMGWEAVKIARCPAVLFFNLENRIIPRCRVIKVLISKGILKKDMGLTTFLMPSERQFLEKFVSNYDDKVPGLLNAYRGKTGPLETGLGSKDPHEIK